MAAPCAAMEKRPGATTPALGTPGNRKKIKTGSPRRRPAEEGEPKLKMGREYIRVQTAKIVTRRLIATAVIEARHFQEVSFHALPDASVRLPLSMTKLELADGIGHAL